MKRSSLFFRRNRHERKVLQHWHLLGHFLKFWQFSLLEKNCFIPFRESRNVQNPLATNGLSESLKKLPKNWLSVFKQNSKTDGFVAQLVDNTSVAVNVIPISKNFDFVGKVSAGNMSVDGTTYLQYTYEYVCFYVCMYVCMHICIYGMCVSVLM